MNFSAPVLGAVRLAQAAPTVAWWPVDAQAAVRAYDDLLARAALVRDADARGQILSWIDRSDVPGSPAERYQTVADALGQGAPSSEVLRKRLDDLEAVNRDLEARVKNAETAYGALSVPAGTGGTPESGKMAMKCLAGGLALLGLIVLPLLWD